MNILTFDIEDWFHILDNASSRTEVEWRRYPTRISENTGRLLELLARHGQLATFFCVGWVAEQHPGVIRRIAAAGHEIASHSYGHQLVHEQGPDEFRQDIERSIRSLEDLTGRPVRAYRAPGFSITRRTRWALPILGESGIEIDCSIFPGSYAHGGFPTYGPPRPSMLELQGCRLKEFPLSHIKIGPLRVAFSGGGYFRLLPFSIVKQLMMRSSYTMSYFHPRDFDPGQPILPGLPPHRILKSYVGLRSAFAKLDSLLREFQFVDLSAADLSLDWSAQPTVHL